jgi:hypothetical protein
MTMGLAQPVALLPGMARIHRMTESIIEEIGVFC